MASNIPVIVQGNSFSLAIPLQIYYINGDQMDLQDYTPDPTDEISIQLKGERRQYTYTPTVDGNICNIDLSGNELAGNYSVVVSIVKASGQRLRSFRTDQFFIVESSDDLTTADIIEGLEENVIYLNSSIFVAGEDGRGIESIVKTATVGLVDTYTITYSDNTTSTFDVTNGAQGQDGEQGADGVGITSIEKTATVGLVDTYTITLSNGETSTFDVTNGKDGVDLGLANIVDNLTTGGSTNVLSAEQGKVLKGLVDDCYTKNDSGGSTYEEQVHYTILKGKFRSYSNVFEPTNTNAKRATLSTRLTKEQMAGAKRAIVPAGYSFAIQQANTSSDYTDSTWLGNGTIDLTQYLDDQYEYKAINFKKSPETNFDDTDVSTLEANFYIVFERHSESGSAIDIVSENGTPTKSIYNPNDLVNVKVYSKDAIDALFGTLTTGTSYQGERIRLQNNKFVYEEAFSMSNTSPWQFRQGGAVYDKYFFQFYTNNAKIQIYDLATGTLVQTLSLTENVNNHAGSGGFSAYKVSESDPFPLLYQSSQDEGKIYVYRITGTEGNWNITLYQTITMPSGTNLMYLPNVAIDAINNVMVFFGYKVNSWSSPTNNETIITSYIIPDPTHGDITLSASDAMRVFTLPFIYAQQGACAYGGMLYMTFGNTTSEGGLFAINYVGGVITSRVDLSVIGSIEPEAIGIYNGKFYVSTAPSASGKMYRLVF